MADTTALATIWNDPRLQPGQLVRYELLENFRPVWRTVLTAQPASATSTVNLPLASLLALHLDRTGTLTPATGLHLPTQPREPLRLQQRQAHAIYKACAGLSITLVRFAASCVRDRELTCMRRAGIDIDLLDASTLLRDPA